MNFQISTVIDKRDIMEENCFGDCFMNTKLTIQEKLKDLRVERRLTLEQLAEETGISKSALGKTAPYQVHGKGNRKKRK